jgi:hypothetical protein
MLSVCDTIQDVSVCDTIQGVSEADSGDYSGCKVLSQCGSGSRQLNNCPYGESSGF